MIFSPVLNSNVSINKGESFLSAIPNNNELINNEMTINSRKNSFNDNYNKFISSLSQASSATSRIGGNITETHPFIGLLSRSAVIV